MLVKRQWFVQSRMEDIRQFYNLGDEVGSGTYGKVYIAEDINTYEYRAVKQIEKNRVVDYNTFENEIEILRELDHPNIVKIIETFESSRHCYVVLEYCEGGDLFSRIVENKRLSEHEAAFYMKSLFSAVSYCHDSGVCHKDLKPENCLLVTQEFDSDLKIIDFGLSQILTEYQVMHSCDGTPYYLAPEILDGAYTKEVDCWSLGVILYIMLSGRPPFEGQDNEEILENVYNGYFSFKPHAFKRVSDSAKDLISRLLVKDPKIRLTAREALGHPWIEQLVPLSNEQLPIDVYGDLANFVNSTQLKRTSMILIANKLSERDIEELRATFKSIDVNGDGTISYNELYNGLSEIGVYMESMNFEELCLALDANENEIIDYTEFLAACAENEIFSNQGYLKSAFEYFDIDGSGFISVNELREVMNGGEIEIRVDERDLESMIREADHNRDGIVDYREFIEMMMHKN